MYVSVDDERTDAAIVRVAETVFNSMETYAVTDPSVDQLDDRDVANFNFVIGDYLAIEIEGPGTIGHAATWEDNGITVAVTEDPPAYMEPQHLDISNVHDVEDEDRVVVFVDTTENEDGDEPRETVYEVNFTVDADENPYVDDNILVQRTVAIVEPDVFFGQDQYTVGAAPEQGLSGGTNVAPGRTVEISAEAPEQLSRSRTTDVDENGEWSVALDLSPFEPGVDFDLTATVVEFDVTGTATGSVEDVAAAFSYDPDNPVAGEEVTFDAGDSTGPIDTWEWASPGVADFPATGTTVAHTFDEPGEYEVTVTVTGSSSTTTSMTETVSIDADAEDDEDTSDSTDTATDDGTNQLATDDEEDSIDDPDSDGDDGFIDEQPGPGIVGTLVSIVGAAYVFSQWTDSKE